MKEKVEGLIMDIDEKAWAIFSAKLPSAEAMDVLRELVRYTSQQLVSRIEEVGISDASISFFSKGREFLTFNITRKGVRVYFHPPAGVLFGKDEAFSVEKTSNWESSFQKSSGMYRAMTAWVSKKEHLSGIKTLIDRIPITI